MQSRDRYPNDAVTGGCFVTRRYEIAPGERICDLDCDLDTLPAWGRLCVSELGVRMMADCLGLVIPDQDLLEANAQLERDINELRAENMRLRRAFAQVVIATKLAGVASYIDGLEEAS